MPEGDIERVTLVAGTPAYPPGDAAVATRMAAVAETAKAAEESRRLEESIGVVAAAAAAQTPGLIEGAVAHSLDAVVSLAESQNPNLGVALRGVLGTMAEYSQSATPSPAQLINPPNTGIGGM
jgi:hypothetical protein